MRFVRCINLAIIIIMTDLKEAFIRKQEHQGVNNMFSHFLYLNFFRIIRIIQEQNNKN